MLLLPYTHTWIIVPFALLVLSLLRYVTPTFTTLPGDVAYVVAITCMRDGIRK